MCGIAAIVELESALNSELCYLEKLGAMLRVIARRGDSDKCGEVALLQRGALGTNRLAVTDRDVGRQPASDNDARLHVVFNGEIYNYREIQSLLKLSPSLNAPATEAQTLLCAYHHWGIDCLKYFEGIYAFIIYDEVRNVVFAARDPVGVKPLYYGLRHGIIFLASEQKCFLEVGVEPVPLLPGEYIINNNIHRYSNIRVRSPKIFVDMNAQVAECRDIIHKAVIKQASTDLPLAVVFSGGLDSAIILALAVTCHPQVTAFTIGRDGSEDLEAAVRFCKERAINHVVISPKGPPEISEFRQLIYDSEMFEPMDLAEMAVMYQLYSHVRSAGIKVALSGDGSDELFAGYDIFRSCDDPDRVMEYRLNNLHRTDLQRTDRSSMCNSVEARVPFLDPSVIRFATEIPFQMKMYAGTEKYILREAFADLLPPYILGRRKLPMLEGSGVSTSCYRALSKLSPEGFGVGAESPLTGGPAFHGALHTYLQLGFPVPRERHRMPALDFPADAHWQGG